IKQRFSTPTWNGYGIDATYSLSDQREYFCRCHACRHWQVPLWDRKWVVIPGLPGDISLDEITENHFHKMRLDESLVVCERCGAPLDLDDTSREWVAKFPTRTSGRGYRIRPFSSGRITTPYIIEQMFSYTRKDFVRGWYNTVLGEPYTDSKARLTEAAIKACMETPTVPELSSDTPVFLGIDMGQICHLTLGTIKGNRTLVFDFQAVRVDDLLPTVQEINSRYHLIAGACDRHPYTPTADALRDATSGRVMPIEYRGDPELKPVENLEEVITHWQANRTKLLDEVARAVRTREFAFSGYGMQAGVLVSHLRDMIREEDPEKPAKWVKLTGADHYFHSLAFLRAATRLPTLMNILNKTDNRSIIIANKVTLQTPGNLFGRTKRR
ncbi:MAG TPA: phage terminase large subunit family protein, partial [Rhodopila sp.]|nr:phage terminase large subunit family protein [Rhodopila sp.]